MNSEPHDDLRRRARRAEHPAYETLIRYAEGSLAASADAGAVERHLAACPLCLEQFLFLSQELLPDLARPASLSERARCLLRGLVARFEEQCRTAAALAPLFRLAPAPRKAGVAVQSAAPSEKRARLRVDLDRDPRHPYVTILVEDRRGEIAILETARTWLNVETARAPAVEDFPAAEPATLVAVYTAAPVPAAGAAEFLESLEKHKISFRLAAAPLAP